MHTFVLAAAVVVVAGGALVVVVACAALALYEEHKKDIEIVTVAVVDDWGKGWVGVGGWIADVLKHQK